jgi:ATP-dependent exoDNAse (exonuclease V) beta subunit
VQDLTSAELALLVKMSTSGILFLAGDPAQSVEEGVDFRFEDARSVFYELTGRAPTKPLTLALNFRSHTGILDAAGVLLEWLLKYFPGSCKKLPQDDGLCRGPRPGWAMPVSHTDLARQSSGAGLVILTPDENLRKLKEDLLQCVVGSDDKDMSQVLGIREAKGLDFAEVIVDFFRCLDERQQASWKQLLQASSCNGFCDEHPEVETHLKLLYTAVTRSQRRLNFVETVSSKTASAFFRRLQEEGKLVKLSSDSSELKLATGMMSPDEWIHRGLEFAWKAWECRSQDRGGGGTGGESQEDELRWLDNARECFSKAGSSGQCLVSHFSPNTTSA